MDYLVFGNENAENDELLATCYVEPPSAITGRPVLTGRWGTGKTAILIHKALELERVMRGARKNPRSVWLLNESTLDLAELRGLQRLAGSTRELERALEHVWKAEIVRAACIQLADLWKHYGSPRNPHWEHVARLSTSPGVLEPLWKNAAKLAALVLRSDDDAGVLSEIQENYRRLSLSHTSEQMQLCLEDCKAWQPQPVVAIEPIDSPTSDLETEPGLARTLIDALLNLFQAQFQPSSSQLLNVRLSIPWHRYDVDALVSPQKVTQYLGHVTWNATQLREFINRRIEWEFRRVQRGTTPKGGQDAWRLLFGSNVKNLVCASRPREDSFGYVLRHTHHRARDLQKVARMAVEADAIRANTTVDDVLRRGGQGGRVSEHAIREAVRKFCAEYFPIRETEAMRRFPQLRAIVHKLDSLQVPFTHAEFERRLRDLPEPPASDALDQLWDAGLVGLEITPQDENDIQVFKDLLGDDCYRTYQLSHEHVVHKWFRFEYNSHESLMGLVRRLEGLGKASPAFVLHPLTFETLTPRTTKEYPLGA